MCHELLSSLPDGRSKLWVIHRALEFRQQNAALFRNGRYEALKAAGSKQQHVIAYQRVHEGQNVIVAVPRFAATLMHTHPKMPLRSVWSDTYLPVPVYCATAYRNLFTGERLVVKDHRLKLADVFAEFPVAMLASE